MVPIHAVSCPKWELLHCLSLTFTLYVMAMPITCHQVPPSLNKSAPGVPKVFHLVTSLKISGGSYHFASFQS